MQRWDNAYKEVIVKENPTCCVQTPPLMSSIPRAIRFSRATIMKSQKYSLMVGTGFSKGLLTKPISSRCSKVILQGEIK